MDHQLLIVEDDLLLQEIISDYFVSKGWKTAGSVTGVSALNLVKTRSFDLVLLDVMLPGMDGFSVCRRIREFSDIPIIFLTARILEEDAVNGYRLGADDYITKPFSMKLLYAKAEALVTRYQKNRVTQSPCLLLSCYDFSLDTESHKISIGESSIPLPHLEYKLLKLFMEHPMHLFSRDQLLLLLWDASEGTNERIIDNHIKRLRKLLGPYSWRIETISLQIKERFENYEPSFSELAGSSEPLSAPDKAAVYLELLDFCQMQSQSINEYYPGLSMLCYAWISLPTEELPLATENKIIGIDYSGTSVGITDTDEIFESYTLDTFAQYQEANLMNDEPRYLFSGYMYPDSGQLKELSVSENGQQFRTIGLSDAVGQSACKVNLSFYFPYLYSSYSEWCEWSADTNLHKIINLQGTSPEESTVNCSSKGLSDYTSLVRNVTPSQGESFQLGLNIKCHFWKAAFIYLRSIYLASLLLLLLLLLGLWYLLKKAEDRKKELYQKQQQFINLMAHELKTPLATIRGIAENLSEHITPEKEDYYLSKVIDQTRQMDQMLSNLLTASRDPSPPPAGQAVELGSLIMDILSAYSDFSVLTIYPSAIKSLLIFPAVSPFPAMEWDWSWQ